MHLKDYEAARVNILEIVEQKMNNDMFKLDVFSKVLIS